MNHRIPTHSCGAALNAVTKQVAYFKGLLIEVPPIGFDFPGPESSIGTTPIIRSLNFLNTAPWRRWAPDDRQFVTLHSIRDEEVADINVFRALAARNLSIRLEKNRALVILVQDIVLDPVTLSIHKIPRPAYRWHEIVCCDHLGLRGAPSVQPVLVRPDNWDALQKRHRPTT
jgi:hypothetical protein